MPERIRIGDQTDLTDGGPGALTMGEAFGDAMRAVECYDLDGPEPGPSKARELLHLLAGVARAIPAVAHRLEASMRLQYEAGELRRPEGASVAASVSSLEGASIADVELIDEW